MRPLEVQRRTCPGRRASARSLLLLSWFALGGACHREIPVDVFVDGFEPETVRFEVEDLGDRAQAELSELSGRGDIDGLLLLPPGSCDGPCRAVIVSIFVHNRGSAEAPPVVRLQVPEGKPTRKPIPFRGGEISQGRIGRIRWIVELWPTEKRLTATVSSSVFLVGDKGPAPAAPPAPTPAPPTAPTPPVAPPEGSTAR